MWTCALECGVLFSLIANVTFHEIPFSVESEKVEEWRAHEMNSSSSSSSSSRLLLLVIALTALHTGFTFSHTRTPRTVVVFGGSFGEGRSLICLFCQRPPHKRLSAAPALSHELSLRTMLSYRNKFGARGAVSWSVDSRRVSHPLDS